MNCKKCNFEFPCEVKFCPVCGERQTEGIPAPKPVINVPPPQENGMPPQYPAAPPPGYLPPPRLERVKDSPKYVGFGEAIALYFKNYVNFKARSTRSEYWYAFLFTSLIGICCWFLNFVIPGLSYLASAAFFVPDLAITFRRFHDTGRTGTFPLIKTIVCALWSVLSAAVVVFFILAICGAIDDDIISIEGWLVLLFTASGTMFIPLGLKIYEIVICCFDSQHKPNKYGREPRY